MRVPADALKNSFIEIYPILRSRAAGVGIPNIILWGMAGLRNSRRRTDSRERKREIPTRIWKTGAVFTRIYSCKYNTGVFTPLSARKKWRTRFHTLLIII